METALTIIKVLGILVGGLAALREMTKEKDGGADKRSRLALLLFALGLSSAIAAEVVDLAIKRKSGEEALQRNNELLADVERTLHPLFPLTVHVTYNSSLTEPHAAPLRHLLETKLAEEKRTAEAKGQDKDLLSVGIRSGDTSPSQTDDPFGFGLVQADIGSWVRLYGKEKTAKSKFEQDDLNFCVCPFMHRESKLEEYSRVVLENRRILFDPKRGLDFDDGEVQVNFADANSHGAIASSDDLYGAMLELEVDATFGIPIPVGMELNNFTDFFTLNGLELGLPGNQRIWIKGNRFSRSVDKNQRQTVHYRFQLPSSRAEFEKLIVDY